MIVTENICPPVPGTQFDWVAFDEDRGEDGLTGRGATEAEALRDLAEKLAAELRERAP